MTSPDDETLGESISGLVIYFVILGVVVIFLGYAEIAFWTMTAERQTHRVRQLAFKSIMKQHIGWFDVHQTGELNTRLSE